MFSKQPKLQTNDTFDTALVPNDIYVNYSEIKPVANQAEL